MEYSADSYSFSDSSARQDSDSCEQENCSPEIKCYTILSSEDISERQKEAIRSISSLCSLSQPHSKILLHHFNWKVADLLDEWFKNEQKVRTNTGLFHKAPVKEFRSEEQLYCSICMETHSISDMKALVCDHYFCNDCWLNYIQIAIRENGLGCLSLRCPHPKCGAAVGEDTVLCFITEEQDRAKYGQFCVESYVGQNRRIKWCPAPDCEYAVELDIGITQCYDVTCKCSYNFCWSCSEEMHRPINCDIVRKWVLKNRDNAETENWKIINTKPCPQCGRAIEKHEGCMHMTCVKPCKFQFCWLCLRDWQVHSDSYACNRFEAVEQGTQNQKSETEEERIKRKQREAIKRSLDRYGHYYERWASHEKSRAKAVSDLKRAEDFQIKQLSDIQGLLESYVKFVRDAWAQIVECRRVLKWTYAYGYYLTENESAHKEMFEHSQAYAESHLERLHDCVERELQVFIESERPAQFHIFRVRVGALTIATGRYFENLINALEKEVKKE